MLSKRLMKRVRGCFRTPRYGEWDTVGRKVADGTSAAVVRARPRLGTVPDLACTGTGVSIGATPRPSRASTSQAGKKVTRWLRVVSGRQARCWPADCSS